MQTFEQREHSNNPENGDILVVGNGYVGEKAQQLIDKAEALKEIGFRVPPMTVLAQDFFDDFFRENNLGNSLAEVPEDKIPIEINDDDFRLLDQEQIESLYQTDNESPKKQQTLNVLQEICQMYNGVLIHIQFTAEDNKGGVHSNTTTENKIKLVEEAIKKMHDEYLATFPKTSNKAKQTITIRPKIDDRNSTPNKIKRATFSQEQTDTLQNLCQRFGENPIVVRSSAAGDACGNGIYKSVVTVNEPESVQEALKTALASYFTQSAIDFRRDAKTGTGMGIIIEPLVGKKVNQYFFPILSGFGYTSTINDNEGYVNVDPGFGCAVKSRYSERITKTMIDQHDGVLTKYIRDELSLIKNESKPYRRSTLLRQFADGIEYGHGEAFCFLDKEVRIKSDVSITKSNDFYEVLNDNFGEIFQMMTQAEQRFGAPQYFEFAVTFDSGKSNFWVIQIADVTDLEKETNYIDFDKTDKTLIEAHSVNISGIRNVSKTVFCFTEKDVDQLLSFNQRNTNYMLVYSSELLPDYKKAKIFNEYEYFSNASVILQLQTTSNRTYANVAIGHYGGKLANTGKIFGVFGHKGEGYEFIKPNTEEQSLGVYNGELTIKASSRQNRLIVVPNENK
jgi:hypothetical protein